MPLAYNHRKVLVLTGLALTLGGMGPAGAQTVFCNFNSAGQYSSSFNAWNDGGGVNSGNYDFAENASDGVGGSGGVAVFQSTDTTAIYNGGTWNLATNGATVFASVLIYADGQSSGDKVQLGFLNSPTNGLYSNAGVAFESMRFIPSSATSWPLYEQYRTNNVTVNSAALGTVTVTPGRWYQFVLAVTNTSGVSGRMAASAALYDYGVDGLAPGTNLVNFPTAVSHPVADLAGIPGVWAGLRAMQDGGISAWDNFLVATPVSAPVITWSLTNTNLAAGAPVSFKALADGPGAITYSWYSNIMVAATGTNPVFTVAAAGTGFTNVMVVARNANGAVTNRAMVTVTAPAPPQITGLAVAGIQATAATVSGQVVANGGSAGVTLFYGPADGGTNAGNWANALSLGAATGAFSGGLTGLASNTVYYCTALATNGVGTGWVTPALQFPTLASNPPVTFAAVLTYQYDNTRMGVNTNETQLTLANVNTNSFGQLFHYAVDGYVYAQPLVVPGVTIPGKGVHDVVYVATEHNTVYAFDANSNTGSNALPLWQTSFLVNGATTVPYGEAGTTDLTPEIGITSTPVIDAGSGTIYLEVKTKEPGPVYVHRLHALDITTGWERTNFNSPAVIATTNYPGVGSGDNDGQTPSHVLWNPLREHSRPALTLLNGMIYLAFASHGDNQPYHGWLLGYSATNVALQTGVYNATPNGAEGGFWDGGGGPSVDAQGNLYWQTGNGTFDGGSGVTLTNDYAMSILKFSTTNGLKLVDYFAPSNAVNLSNADEDLGASAALILPDAAGSAAHPHLVVGGGKTQPVYLVDRDNMGRFNGVSGNNKIVQQLNIGPSGDRDTSPVFFNQRLYLYDFNTKIGGFVITNGLMNAVPMETPDTYANKGGATATISTHGVTNAILWALASDGNDNPVNPVVLRAYNATNLTQELYTSAQLPARDAAGDAVKFTVPAVANGKVYVGSQYELSVYGLASAWVGPVAISPAGGIFTNSVTVKLTDATPGATIYYTLDGSAPGPGSLVYTGPLGLTNSGTLTAAAFAPGAVASQPVSAAFLNSASVGNGTGLQGKYWANTTPAAFTTAGFNTAPTLTRVDPTVNFNWNTTNPATNIGPNTYVVQWTGTVVPQFNETYTFYATADDGVLLWVNGQLLVNGWVDQGPTTYSGTIALKAQQRYNIVMDYYQDGGGAVAQLAWSSRSTGPMTTVPQSQLYPVTNPPPVVALTGPTNGAVLTAAASVVLAASAGAAYNAVSQVAFYSNGQWLGTVTNAPYTLTATGLPAGTYRLTAVAADTTGLLSTSAPIALVVKAGSGLPYGLTNAAPTPAFYNLPAAGSGTLPAQLSLTGVFTNPAAMTPAAGLIPYAPNAPFWSDGAQKIRFFAVPTGGQIGFAPTNNWTFPAGSVFVKTFLLQTNASDPASLRRLETRLLVRDVHGTAYGVTYKWRPDNSDADLLTSNLTEAIAIQTPGGMTTQNWYYPSSTDCLQCHTAAAGYVLGVNTRQLNGIFIYPNGAADNQLRALNRTGVFNPVCDEAQLPALASLVAVTNGSATLVARARSYLDANCANCHQPNGPGPTFDARYDTPLTNQNLINVPAVKGSLGYDNVNIVTPNDVWRSSVYDRINVVNPAIQMPPLARSLIDTNGVQLLAQWINSLGGTPTLPPPALVPAGGNFQTSVSVTLVPPTNGVTLHYTLDGSLPTTNSPVYAGRFQLTNSATVNANAWLTGYVNSVAGSGQFTWLPPILFSGPGGVTNGKFEVNFTGVAGSNYVLQTSTNLQQWQGLSTNRATNNSFLLIDPLAPGSPQRFYRVTQQP